MEQGKAVAQGMAALYRPEHPHFKWLQLVDDAAWHSFVKSLKSRRSFEQSFSIIEEPGRLQLRVKALQPRGDERVDKDGLKKLVDEAKLGKHYKDALSDNCGRPGAPERHQDFTDAADLLLKFSVSVEHGGRNEMVLRPEVSYIKPREMKERRAP